MVLKTLLSLKLNNIVLKLFTTILLLLVSTSCSNTLEQNNKNFLNKYGSQVNRINSARERSASKQVIKAKNIQQVKQAPWKYPAKIMGIDGTYYVRSAFIDTDKLKLKANPQDFLPNFDTFMHGQNMKNMYPDIFKASYETKNYPTSYKKDVISFDDIKIPKHDYFGIKSNLSEKQYDIIDHKILQENIDYVHDYLNMDNKEINLILLKEKEEIRRQRIADLLIAKIKEEEEEGEITKEEGGEITTQEGSKEAMEKTKKEEQAIINETIKQTAIDAAQKRDELSRKKEKEEGLPPLPTF